MQTNYKTQRLDLQELTAIDYEFILELVNSPEWLKFISDGNTKTGEQVTEYIQKIIDNPNYTYWVVRLLEGQVPIGVITFMKRDYLEYCDIGFAFLSQFAKMGYAFEATAAVLDEICTNTADSHILAVTIPENVNSIRLLEKLGFSYNRELIRDAEKLLLYSAPINRNEQEQIP